MWTFWVTEWRIHQGAEELQHHFLGLRKWHSNILSLGFDILSFSLVWACGSLWIIFCVTSKLQQQGRGKCWGSKAMLDIFGPYSSTGRQASELPFQLLSPSVLSFSRSLSFLHFTDSSVDGKWWIVWVLISRRLVSASLRRTASGRWWWQTPWLW